MYIASFGLRRAPFEDRADAALYFPSAGHKEAVAALQHEVRHGQGVGLMYGESGTGKTIVLRTLARQLGNDTKIVILTVPANGAVDVLRETCKSFGVSLPSSIEDARGLSRLRRHLLRNVSLGGTPILIIDQAEHLSPGDLADVESLLELQNENGCLLRIVLAAHPRFHALLEQPAFARLRQLTAAEHRLRNLTEHEAEQYVHHRLHMAGAAGRETFSPDALSAIFELSHGVPRAINRACHAAMLAAYESGAVQVTARHVHAASPAWAASSNIPAARAVDHIERTVENLLDRSLETVLALESRLASATLRAEQATAQAERAEHAFARAEQIESRLTAFADQLAGQMDSIQSRVAELIKFATPLEDARKGLEAVVQNSNAAREKTEQSVAEANAILAGQRERTLAEMQSSFSTLLSESSQTLQSVFEVLQKQADTFIAQSHQSIKSLTTECEQRFTKMAQAAEAQVEVAARAASDHVLVIEQTTAEMHDAVQDGQREIHSAVQKAQRSGEDLKKATELAKQEVRDAQEAADRIRLRTGGELNHAADQALQESKNAQEAAERLRMLNIDSTQAAARLVADTTAARHVSENIGGLISSADMKIGQLASIHAASSHLHERLGKLMLTAHPLAERADDAMGRLQELLSQTGKAQSQLADQIHAAAARLADGTAQIDQLQQGTARAEKLSSHLQSTMQAAAQVHQELASARTDATEASARISDHLHFLHEAMQKSEAVLAQHQLRIDALETALRQSSERAQATQERANQIQAVVDNTQDQSKHLERVCTVVRKVSSGLSQATLHARDQARELDKFVTQANQTACTLRQWIEQVHARLGNLAEVHTPRAVPTPPSGSLSPTGTLEREAEILVANEPGAGNAHKVEGGMDAAKALPYSAQARDIAELIESARRTKTDETELDAAVLARD